MIPQKTDSIQAERNSTRRQFLKQSAGLSALPVVTRPVGILGANDRLNLGFIGCGGQGTSLIRNFFRKRKASKMGKVLWTMATYNRNARTGVWDYPIPGVGMRPWPNAEVSPKNLDWRRWLGPAPQRPFSRERFFRWRKYWDYSGGVATDLLYHVLGVVCTMLEFDFPTRVTGSGRIYVQKNREVPDTFISVAEYPGDYTVNMTSCMANAQPIPLTIYGNWGTLKILDEPIDTNGKQNGRGSTSKTRRVAVVEAEPTFAREFKDANNGKTELRIEPEERPSLVDDWLDCMRSRQQPVYDTLKGYQVMVAIQLGVDSYREGKALAFDPATRRVLPKPPPRPSYPPPEPA